MLSAPDISPLSGHVIVCGLGHVGYRIVRLLSRLGERGVVITPATSEEWRLEAETRFAVVIGDAREEKRLREAGVERARAIIIVTDDDLANVSIALDARRRNPQITIAARLFDQALAAHLEKSAGIHRVFSTSALAVPAFVAAALGETVLGEFEVDGAACVIEEQLADAGPVAAGRTIGQWSQEHQRAVLALQQDGRTTLNPDAACLIRFGDRLTSLRFVNEARSAVPAPARSGITALRALAVGLREWWRDVPTALRAVFLSLLAVVLLSVVVFHLQLGLPLVDSFYFVITTVTTVGYGDYNLMNASPWMKLYGALVMLCGAAVLAALFSIVADLVIGTRLRDVIARGCAEFRGHIIVAGLGNIGFRLMRELARSGETVVAIERREAGEFVEVARELGPVVRGNAKADETLRRAGVAGAKALIAATDDDLANLSIGLATKRARASCRVVARLFDSKLAEQMQPGLGLDAVLSVSAAAAPTFVGALLCPDALYGVVLPNGLVSLFRRTMADGCDGGFAAPEFPLFVKHRGEDRYVVADACAALWLGDEIIGARWHPFREPEGET